MAYRTYTTRAVVCGSRDSYTSDRSYLLFTEDAGMLWASARSVRMEKSKQRYGLQDFSCIRVSLIKGKTGWKIGSTEAVVNPFLRARSRSERALVTYLVRQLRRYVHGEESVRPLFADTWTVLSDLALVNVEDIDILQSIYTLRLLYALGYVDSSKELMSLLEPIDSLQALSFYTTALSSQIAIVTKKAETVSHL